MHRRTFIKGMAGAAGVILLPGCADKPQPAAQQSTPAQRPTVRVEEWTSLGYPSPFTYTAGPGYWRMSLLFDTLLWPDSTGQQIPWLASSYKRSDDGLTHTLDLRAATWSDGRPVTARDVAFTYQYYTSQLFTPLLVGVPRAGAEVVTTGERTVEFRLRRPDATFVQSVLGTMPIAPEHIWSKISDPMSASGREALIGSGPYTLESRDETQGTEAYVARDDYVLGPPWVKRIEMLPVANDDALTTLQSGGLDGANTDDGGVRNEELARFRDNPDYGIISQPAAFGFPLYFNMTRGGALADVRFRRAVLHAIDRDELVRDLLTGNGTPGAAGFLPPTHGFYNANARAYPFNRAEAERLLDEAGYRRPRPGDMRISPDRGPLRFSLHIPEPIPNNLADRIEASLKAVGIDVNVQRLDLVRTLGVKIQPAYDLLLSLFPGPGGIGPSGDPELLRSVYATRPFAQTQKATGYSNPEVDRLLDAQLAATDLAERRRLVGEIQRIVAEDLPVAMIYYSTYFFVFRNQVFDQWYYTPGGFGPGIPEPYNKAAYTTGRKQGTEVRRVGG